MSYYYGASVAGVETATVFAKEVSAPMTSPASEVYPNSVYKYYDVHNILIYVGITRNGILRNRQHNSDKPWWLCVARQEVEHFDSREAAHIREVELIRLYRPPFNIQHNFDHADIRAAYVALGQEGKLGLSLKAAVKTGFKRSLPLVVLTRDAHHIVFTTNLADAPITACLKHVAGVRVVSQVGQVYGKVGKIKIDHPFARISATCKVPHTVDIVGAEARIKYMSIKQPQEIHLSSIRVVLG